MLHPDYQYDATRIPALIAPDRRRQARPDARQPLPGRPAGRRHAALEVRQQPLPDRSSRTSPSGSTCPSTTPGLRAYSRRLLETIPYQLNSDDFVFDQELIAQVVAAGMAAGSARSRVPTRYFEEASLGRLQAQRRLRPVDPARRRPLPAPPAARAPLAEARRPTPPRLTGRCGSSRSALLRGTLGDRDQRRRDLASSSSSVDLDAACEVLRTAIAGLDRGHARDGDRSTSPPGAALASASSRRSRRCRTAASSATRYIGYLANNVLPARLGELVSEPRARRGRGDQPDDGRSARSSSNGSSTRSWSSRSRRWRSSS